MKKLNLKKTTALLAATVAVAACGALCVDNGVSAAAATEAKKYELSTIGFSETGSSDVVAKTVADKSFTALEYAVEGGTVNYKRNLALKWKESATATKYFTFKFSFLNLDFATFEITFTANSAFANKDNKAVNVVAFEKKADGVYVKVNSGAETKLTDPTADLTLSLSEKAAPTDADYGKFLVNLAEGSAAAAQIGEFENVGENYAPSSLTPMAFKMTMPEDAADTVKGYVLVKELNGQSFELDTDSKVTDNAKPVLIVNQEVNSFVIGNSYGVSTQVVDVLTKSPTSKATYYQYDPDDVGQENYGNYIDLSSTVYFGTTNYDSNGDDKDDATVYGKVEEATGSGREYVSVVYELSDETYQLEDEKAYVHLAWYSAAATDPHTSVQTSGYAAEEEIKYIPVEESNEGASYSNTFDADAYQQLVTDAAADKTAGSGKYFYLPSLKGAITDNDGFTNLSFTIAYNSDKGGKSSSSSLAYNNLRISITNVGWYEFKVFANDKAGNKMICKLDGEDVEVTTENVWDIEEIPSFKFFVGSGEFHVDDESSAKGRKDTETVYDKYTFDKFDFIGDTDPLSEVKLFFVNVDKYEAVFHKTFDEDNLVAITYEEIKDLAATKTKAANVSYFSFYLDVYAELLAKELKIDKASLLAADIFEEIYEDQGIDQEAYPEEYASSHDAYEWQPTSRSFVAQKQGYYMMFGVYTDSDAPAYRAAAYRVVVIEAEKDVITGEEDYSWWKNNLLSVILFAISGVMLILFIVLLVVKPTDETLDDVEAKAKNSKKEKKVKKEKSAKKAEETKAEEPSEKQD